MQETLSFHAHFHQKGRSGPDVSKMTTFCLYMAAGFVVKFSIALPQRIISYINLRVPKYDATFAYASGAAKPVATLWQ